MESPHLDDDRASDGAFHCPFCGEAIQERPDTAARIGVNQRLDEVLGGKLTGIELGQVSGNVTIEEVSIKIGTWIERSLTAAENARESQSFAPERLAQGVHALFHSLEQQTRPIAGLGDDNPYKGLTAYNLSDAESFFGRQAAIHSLLSCLQNDRLTVLHAESGAGKTSLLRAGITPRLLTAGHLPVHIRSHNENPAQAVKRAFLPIREDLSELLNLLFCDFLRQVSDILGQSAVLFVFFDQFEEFFTLLTKEQRQAFITEWGPCLDDPRLNVRWVLALRTEFLGRLDIFLPRINPSNNRYYLQRLTDDEARQVITAPAAERHVRFDEQLVENLLEELGGSQIAPPQLQLVCETLYAERKGDTITQDLYRHLGGAARILQQHLRRVLTQNIPDEHYRSALLLLEALSTHDGQRARRTLDELARDLAPYRVEPDVIKEILKQLVESRLLQVEKVGKALTYELVHDYLVEQIEHNPEAQARKAAQELLVRETTDWQLFGALMSPQTLRVVGAQRSVINIDDTAEELLLKSALETEVDLEQWLDFASPPLAQRTLLAGLSRTDPTLRTRAARHLGRYPDAQAADNLYHCALHDEEQAVRDAALETLGKLAPDQAREVLSTDLEHPQPVRRARAATALRLYLNAEATEKLFHCVQTDEHEQAWTAALQTLASAEAAPYRARWQPLLRAPTWRRAAAYAKLKEWQVALPRSLRWRMIPARTADYFRREITTRPAWLGARVLIVLALYFGLALVLGLPPFVRWKRVPGAPQESLSTVELADGWIYVGSFEYGIARHSPDGEWSDWLQQGLPTPVPKGSAGSDGTMPQVQSIAVDPTEPEHAYALMWDNGLYLSTDAGEKWYAIGVGKVPTETMALDVSGESVLVAAGRHGLYGKSGDNDWLKLDGQGDLPDGRFNIARFDATGVPYAGGTVGLYRGLGDFPWTWQEIQGIPPVRHLAFGLEGHLYLALGEPRATEAACYSPATGLGAVIDLGDQVITALAAHPRDPDVFYAATVPQIREMRCNGRMRALRQVPLVFGVGGLATIPSGNSDYMLLQANSRGLYQRPLP
jgi:hypothetical protein